MRLALPLPVLAAFAATLIGVSLLLLRVLEQQGRVRARITGTLVVGS